MNPFFPFPVFQARDFQQQSRPGDEVPARVRLAMEYLAHCTVKTMTRGMANDVGFDTVPGQELTDEEASAHGTACLLIQSYFRGRLKPSHVEHLVLDAMEDQRECPRPDSAGMLMKCFACAPSPPQPGCPFCHGQGEVIVYPKASGG